MLNFANLLILLAVLAGLILLEFVLARQESWWPGLVLPAISFCFALLSVFSIAYFEGMTVWDLAAAIGSTFLLSNVPTLLFLAIYFACRGKNKRKRELDKMNAQDLE